MTKLSAKIHKWVALIVAAQLLFWFASGLFFAAVPIEWVRSEHRKAAVGTSPVALDTAAIGLGRVAAAGGVSADKVELKTLFGRPVALFTRGEARPVLYDLVTGRQLSPLPSATAIRIAETDLVGPERASAVTLVTSETTEYRGALPAWRVDFAGGTDLSVYVAADTGAVGARRSSLWRVYDFLWSLHIMDYRGHQDFNNPLLILAAGLGLIVFITGAILFPSRLGLTAWRKRRARLREAVVRS